MVHDEDVEMDFESYLNRKTEGPAPMSIQQEEKCTPSKDASVAENSEKEPNPATVAPEPSSDTIDVSDVKGGEKTTLLELKSHPVAGTYLVEVPVIQPIDDEWKTLFIEAYNVAGQCDTDPKARVEKCLDTIHKMEKAIITLKTKSQGIRKRIEQDLRDLNAAERAELMEKDKKFRAKKIAEGPTSRGPATKRSTAGKTSGQKVADTLQSLMMSKDAVIAKLKERKLYDTVTENYVEKIFATK